MNKKLVTICLIIVGLVLMFSVIKVKKTRSAARSQIIKIVQPKIKDINVYISSFGVVKPRNRIALKPSVTGRLETILVEEGMKVKQGQLLAQMSSMERASLLDAVAAKGKDTYRYWENAYKPISIISPINGEIIARLFEPGQVVNSTDTILVVSDRLIVKAQVDETDISKTKIGQLVNITLDAYPENILTGKVTHISYESRSVNNVTIYEVDISLDKTPSFFRSGMSANIDILTDSRIQVLTVPVEAIKTRKNKTIVLIKSEKRVSPKIVATGLSDGQYIEILSGITIDNKIVIKYKTYSLEKKRNRPWGAKSKSKRNKK